MGKYTNVGKKATEHVWDDPEGNAERVINALIEAITGHIGEMGENYLSGIQNAPRERMIKLLTAWYNVYKGYASRVPKIWAEVKRGTAPAPR